MKQFVTTSSELESLVAQLKGSKILAIDTEFLREKTYYPKLCLIQVNNGETKALIDAISIQDLSPFAALLTDNSCMKIFHAATQDIETLYYATGVSPWPLFDTQLAAALLGYPLQVGYGPLVSSVCDVKLPKADGYSDWSRRPLTESQIKYALDDVIYLPKIYETLRGRLEQKNRLHWLDEDFKALADVSRYEAKPYEMWHHIKRVSSLNPKQLAVARELAAWREEEAMQRDIPRKRVLSDETILEVSRKMPRNKEQLQVIRGVSGVLNKRTVNKVLNCVKTVAHMDPKDYPRLASYPRGEAKLDGVVNLMAALVELRAHQNDVATPTLACRDELSRLAHGHREDLSILSGWRFEMVGKELLELLKGNISLHVDNDTIAVAPCN